MIRLNDINKTVIDEKAIEIYNAYKDYMYDHDTEKNKDVETIELRTSNGGITIQYATKEQRDKDIELLDQLFDVKSIEYKAMSVEKPIGYVNGMKEECEPVKEEYITWEDVKQYATMIKVMLPNGENALISWNDTCIYMYDEVMREYRINATIYDEDLFNALMLKKVE